jgi:hypothetical protein
MALKPTGEFKFKQDQLNKGRRTICLPHNLIDRDRNG